ncbi:MAG: DUF7796 domain-containing protein [Candidatus Helarchaeota archaeon]
MKVALCLSGQARGIHKCWDSFEKYIIEPYNCDIFISFANDSSSSNINKVYNFRFTEIELIKDPNLEYLYSIARGDAVYCQHQGIMGKECTNLAVLRQFYYINRANQLKVGYEEKNNFKYDWVIRSRADLIIKSPIGNLNKLDNKNIYIPEINSHGGVNDHFAYGSSENMDIYSDRIGEIKKLESPPFPFWNPHKELKHILDKNKIKIVIVPIIVNREREWRGPKNNNVYKYYGELGKHLIQS